MGQPAPSFEDIAAIQAITTVLHQCARGLDRRDPVLLRSCFHETATDEHAPFFRGTADAFVAWVIPTLSAMLATRHVITNVLVERQGDAAAVESHWSAMLRLRQGDTVQVLSRAGRYLDRFTCEGGVWAIMHRCSVTEWNRSDPETDHDLAPVAIPRHR